MKLCMTNVLQGGNIAIPILLVSDVQNYRFTKLLGQNR